MILLGKISGNEIRSIVSMCHVPHMMVSSTYRLSGEVVLHIYNSYVEAKKMSAKIVFVGVLAFPKAIMS